jgi:uncharacterized membrane protein YfcA
VRANVLRAWLIATLVVAGVISVVAKKTDSRFVGWLSIALFLCAVVLYASWRRAVLRERRAKVFDREAQTTDETRTRPDQ